MRTLIYARYSSQLQNSRSIDQQIGVCRDRASREGWPVIEVFTDYAIGGGAGTSEAQRPGLAAMLARVEQGDIDQVLIDTTSRLARNQGDAHHLRERLNFHGARLFTLGDGEIDSFKGAIKGLLDEQQRVELRHNIKRGQAGTVRQGRSPAGLAYGYRLANRFDETGRPVRGLREVDEVQAAIIRRIFTEYAAGRSPVAIARQLNAEGIPGPRGSSWRASTIRPDRTRGNGMLSNRLYIGQLIHNRTSKVIEPVTRTTRIRPNPESAWIIESVPQLRIIDDALWEAVQTELERNRIEAKPVKTRRPRHILSGLGQCGICGGAWNVSTGRFWSCGARRDGGTCTNNRTISTESYERHALDGLQEQLLDPAVVSTYVREYHDEAARRARQDRQRKSTLERQLHAAAAKVERLVTAVADGGEEFAEIRTALRAARIERDRLAAELAEIAAVRVISLHPMIAEEYRRQVADLRTALTAPAAREAAIPVLRELIDRIILSPNPTGRGMTVEVKARLSAVVELATGEKSGIEPAASKRA